MDMREQQQLINEAQSRLLPKYQAELRRTVGSPVSLEVDWGSFSGDIAALQSLADRAFNPVLSALRDVCLEGSNLQRTQAAVRRIVIRNLPKTADKAIVCREGTLEIRSAWSGDYFSGLHIRKTLERVIESGDYK
jgi:hypothetical protein